MDLKFQWCQYVHSPSGPNYYLLKEKMESFRPKKVGHCKVELKFDPGFRVIEEYLSEIYSILIVNLN